MVPSSAPAAGPALLSDDVRSAIEERAAWIAVSAAFGSLGRAFVCADADFRIIHGSYILDDVFGVGAAASIEARSLESVFGAELFGLSGAMRQALAAGERREGWRTNVRIGTADPRPMSLSAAPFPQDLSLPCSHRIKYVVVLRPFEWDQDDVDGGPRTLGGVIARSPSMLRIFTLIDHLTHTEATVLITGESGTGKAPPPVRQRPTTTTPAMPRRLPPFPTGWDVDRHDAQPVPGRLGDGGARVRCCRT